MRYCHNCGFDMGSLTHLIAGHPEPEAPGVASRTTLSSSAAAPLPEAAAPPTVTIPAQRPTPAPVTATLPAASLTAEGPSALHEPTIRDHPPRPEAPSVARWQMALRERGLKSICFTAAGLWLIAGSHTAVGMAIGLAGMSLLICATSIVGLIFALTRAGWKKFLSTCLVWFGLCVLEMQVLVMFGHLG